MLGSTTHVEHELGSSDRFLIFDQDYSQSGGMSSSDLGEVLDNQMDANN